VLSDVGTEAVETLGELMLFDKNMSPVGMKHARPATCHTPASADRYLRHLTMIAFPGRFTFGPASGQRKRHPYSPFFPVLQYNQEQGLFFGGTSGIPEQPDISCEFPTPNRHRVLRGYSGDGFADSCLRRVSTLAGRVQTSSLKRYGAKARSNQIPTRDRAYLRNPGRGC